MTSKNCFVCGRTQPLSEFYRHPRMADGHLNKCKECTKRHVRENRRKRHDYYVAFDRERNKTEERIERERKRTIERRKDPERRRTFRFPEVSAEQKKRATHALGNAIRDGRVTRQPCVF